MCFVFTEFLTDGKNIWGGGVLPLHAIYYEPLGESTNIFHSYVWANQNNIVGNAKYFFFSQRLLVYKEQVDTPPSFFLQSVEKHCAYKKFVSWITESLKILQSMPLGESSTNV